MKLISILLLAAAVPAVADPRYATITAYGNNGSAGWGTNSLRVEAYEIAELASFPVDNGSPTGFLTILKNGQRLTYRHDVNCSQIDPLVISGPATIELVAQSGTAFATFRFFPDSYPPDRSALVPPGSTGATITLQCSTNLVDWVTATNGLYANEPVAKFFRLKVDPAK